MRILFFNWRDIKNPACGGAEFMTHEIAKYLVSHGHQVCWFTSGFEGCKSEEIIDGYKAIRAGNRYTVYIHAVLNYFLKLRISFDIAIDQINGIPFFTPLFFPGKKE